MTEQLKPCPFCGNTDLKSGGDDKIVGVWCENCQMTGPNHYCGFDWNTRPSASRGITAEEQPSVRGAARVPDCVDPFYPSLIEELAQQAALWKTYSEAEKCPTFSRGDARYIHDLFQAALRSLAQDGRK